MSPEIMALDRLVMATAKWNDTGGLRGARGARREFEVAARKAIKLLLKRPATDEEIKFLCEG